MTVPLDYHFPGVSVIEVPEFIKASESILTDEERECLIEHLARLPRSGALIPNSGGVRKLRWGARGEGKRGGARVIYYFHNENMPLYLLTLFVKSAQLNLSRAELAELRSLVKGLLSESGGV
jgi:hypothetical protein